YQYLPDRGPFNREKIWHTQNDDQPASIVPPLVHITEGPSGLIRYPGTGLPPEHDGAFFVCDFHGTPGTSGVREFWLEQQGATYRLAAEKMFAEGVLATDCDFGPDGALYVLDWIDGWSGAGKGRIHRIVSDHEPANAQRAETEELLKRIDRLSAKELFAALAHADRRVRMAAQKHLAARGPAVAEQLLEMARSAATPLLGRLHAIWTMGQLSEEHPQLFARLITLASDEESEVRVQVARTLARGGAAQDQELRESIGQPLIAMLDDPSPRVRASAAIALGKFSDCYRALPGLLRIARDAKHDAALRHAAVVGLAGVPTDALVDAAKSAGRFERLAIVVALGRQKSDRVAEFLADPSSRVRTEAARVIWDVPLPRVYEELAAAVESVPSDNEPMLRRALAANLALRTPASLRAAIRCGLRLDLSPTMRDHAWTLVRHWASPSPRDPVHGSWRPVEARPAAEVAATLQAALPQMADAGSSGAAGLVVAAELGVAEAYQPVAALVADDGQPPELRARAVAALRTATTPLAIAAIDAAMQSGESAVRSAALQLMLQRFPDQAVGRVIEVAESGACHEQQAAILMLSKLDSPEAQNALRKWLDLLEGGKCPPELLIEVIEAGAGSTDPEIAARAKSYQERLLASEEPLEKFAPSLHGGNAEVGRRIFEENVSFACRRCHSTAPGEKLVGPSLADVGLRLSRQELLSSIVTPNETFAEGFQTTVLQLSTGKVVAGILRSENDNRAVLVDAEGKEIVVDVAEIEDRFEGLSAMPEDLIKQMTPRELRDLVEWLSQQRVAAPGHGTTGR
ncbi:MAG TPA: HEAT repeat domain-containing protein, partial [Lacipirellula sp.]